MATADQVGVRRTRALAVTLGVAVLTLLGIRMDAAPATEVSPR